MRLLTTFALAAALSGGAALAANTMTPAPAAKPAAIKPAPATAAKPAMSDDKKALSKACSDQANAKSLHGKARKEFRNKCKMTGGKAA